MALDWACGEAGRGRERGGEVLVFLAPIEAAEGVGGGAREARGRAHIRLDVV